MNEQPKALFDLSVLVDALTNGDQADHESVTALTLAAQGRVRGYLSAAAVECLNDLLIRTHGQPSARSKLRQLRDALSIAMVDASVIDAAMALGWSYLDDALTHECARVNGLDTVVTLNPSDFASATLPVLAPTEFLQRHCV